MKPANQVTQVLAWKTEDGQLFNSTQEANAHAAKLNFVHWYSSYNGLREIHGAVIDGHEVADWLTDNRAAILEFLAATKGE